MRHLFTNDEIIVIEKYIDTHINRAKQLIESGSMNTAMEVSKSNDVDLFGAQSIVTKKRNEAVEFWVEKRKELQ
jgi:hypothetical protein